MVNSFYHISRLLFPDVFSNQCFLTYFLTNASRRIYWPILPDVFPDQWFLTYFLPSGSRRISRSILLNLFPGKYFLGQYFYFKIFRPIFLIFHFRCISWGLTPVIFLLPLLPDVFPNQFFMTHFLSNTCRPISRPVLSDQFFRSIFRMIHSGIFPDQYFLVECFNCFQISILYTVIISVAS